MAYLKPGYPRKRTDKNGVNDVYMYRGPYTAMVALRPKVGGVFMGLEVIESELQPLEENSNYGELTVLVASANPQADGASSSGDGSAIVTPTAAPVASSGAPLWQEPVSTPPTPVAPAEVTNEDYPYWEKEDMPFERELRTHPEFAALEAADWNALDLWEKESDSEARAAYQYWKRDSEGNAVGEVQTLPTGAAQSYAELRLLGVSVFVDYAPVVRKTSLYQGNSAPSTSDTGQKVSAPSGAPSGYEWIKSGDSASKRGRGNNWVRTEEWTGARKVLVDKDDIFLS